jgi:hypothetical protein
MIDLEALGRAPGLVGDIADWIDATAGKKQPVFALAASLTYVGALLGRRVRGPCGERTNLYCIGVGPSCCGKEHARTQIKKLNQAAGVQDLMGGEDVTSDAAIEMEVDRQKRVLYMWDEVGHMFGNIKGGQSNAHRKTIIPMLMKLYSAAGKRYEGKSYADRQQEKARRAIDQPFVSLYGTTVPGRLFESMDKSELEDGWLGRVLLFETKDNPRFDRMAAMDLDVPDDLVERVAKLGAVPEPKESDCEDGDIAKAQRPAPTRYFWTQPALDVMMAFDDLTETMRETEQREGSGFEALWGRASQQATKIALILAAGDGATVIDEKCINYAKDLTALLIMDLKEAVKEQVADNDHERKRQKVFEVIRRAGKKGATKTDITRKTSAMKGRERNDILDELVDDFQTVTMESLDGTKGARYRAV